MKFLIAKSATAPEARKLDALFIGIVAKDNKLKFGPSFRILPAPSRLLVNKILKRKPIKAGENKIISLGVSPSFVFLSAAEEWSAKKLSLAVRQFIRLAKAENAKRIGFALGDVSSDEGSPFTAEEAARFITENVLLAHFDFSEEFKTKPKDGWRFVKEVVFFTIYDKKKVALAISEAEIIAEATNRCRVLANYPPADLNPEAVAESAREVAKEIPAIKLTIFDDKKLKAEGMNAILAVGNGSSSPPRLIIMEYQGSPSTRFDAAHRKSLRPIKTSDKPLVLIGKGVTFDSGGLNLKPGDTMTDMHMDMSGGAAVIYTLYAIAKLKFPINVVGIIPAVENMPSGFSYRQHDIIKAYGGKTIEVGNTDAEGRVILADAIEYAKTKKPALIVTIATLTGAIMSALGQRMSGLFVKNNHPLQDGLQKIGDDSGDLVWPMPLPDEADKDVEGNTADVINIHRQNSRYGGAITGAAFLWQFAKPMPFAHLDMSPRMTTVPEEDFLSRGAAGFGVRFFVELAKEWGSVEKLISTQK